MEWYGHSVAWRDTGIMAAGLCNGRQSRLLCCVHMTAYARQVLAGDACLRKLAADTCSPFPLLARAYAFCPSGLYRGG